MTDESLFAATLEKPTPRERRSFLDTACANDPDQRRRLEELLVGHEKASGILDNFTGTAPSMEQLDWGLPPADRIGAVLAGRYKLLEEIGTGGMGTVWVAEQTQPIRRKVAVKLIKLGMDTKSVLARFEAERQALALMDHPNIAKVFDGGTTDTGRPFFVMEYVKGVPITNYCDENRLNIADRLALFVLVCQAVQHAHQKGIVHRDLKPSNILVCLYDGKPLPKVIDFGLAKALSQPLTDHTLHTAHGQVLGTPLYMSPEQATINNLDVDTRTDVYTLGVILYELLTGTTPLERNQFRQAAWDEMLRLIRTGDTPRPSTRLGSSDSLPSIAAQRQLEPLRLTKLLRGELDWIVMKCLEKERGRRYDTANGLARDVQRYLADETVEACPPSKRYRLKKFIRQHKGQVIAVSLIFLALLAGVIGTSLGMIEAKRLEGLARNETTLKEDARVAEAAERAKAEAAATQERKAKEEAVANLALAKKWNETLGSVFKSLDPKANYETVGEMSQALANNLKQAVKELDESAIEDPLAIARMQTTLGESLLRLGDTKSAIKVLEKSAETFRTKSREEQHETLANRNALAAAYYYDKQIDRAISQYEKVIEKTQANRGPDHPDTLVARTGLAACYLAKRQFNNARNILEEVLNKQKVELGETHKTVLENTSKLANAYQGNGQSQKAIELLKSAIAKSQVIPGEKNTEALTLHNNLANVYLDNGQPDKAIPLLDIVFKQAQAQLGEDHPRTLLYANNLATAYQDAGQVLKAIPLLEMVLEKRIARYTEDHPSSINSLGNLGYAYIEAQLGEKASAVYVRFINAERKRGPKDDPELAALLVEIAGGLFKCQQFATAEAMLRESLGIREKKEADRWTTFNTQSTLGGALLGQKKYAEAEPLLLKGYEGMKQREKNIPPAGSIRIPQAIERLIELYKATNKPEEVAKWQAERAKYPAAEPSKP